MENKNEELNLEMYASLSLIRNMRKELIDPKVPPYMKETILKTALNE